MFAVIPEGDSGPSTATSASPATSTHTSVVAPSTTNTTTITAPILATTVPHTTITTLSTVPAVTDASEKDDKGIDTKTLHNILKSPLYMLLTF